MRDDMIIRRESVDDHAAIAALHDDAFPRVDGAARSVESALIDELRGDGDVIDVHVAEPVTRAAALAVGAIVGAALVQLSAEGWATRWQPVATLGGSSLVGLLRMGTSGG